MGQIMVKAPHPQIVFSTDNSSTVSLLQFFVCESVVSYLAFVLSVFVPRLSFFGASGSVRFVIV